MYIIIRSVRLVRFLKSIGLKADSKMKNNQGIPSWVMNNTEYIKACIRGLIDTDGSVIPITGRNYTYVWFTCGISKLRVDFDNSMKKLGIRTAKWNHNGTPETYIASKNLIIKYYSEIGFSNPKHIKRFRIPQVHAPIV